ncbi:solute carrier family 23 protein [Spirillospora sp. NPDC127200]
MSRPALTRRTADTKAVGRLDRRFEITARGSSLRVEVLGGLSTFMAMSYIVVVNPAILAQGGFPWRSAFLATALVAGAATVAVGVWARLPFAVAPGMEINALVVFSVIAAHGFGWREALGLVLASGVLMLAVTALGWRSRIIAAVPPRVGTGLVVSVAVFIGMVALELSGLDGLFERFPEALATPTALALYLGFGLACALTRFGIRAAVLLSILASAVYCRLAGVSTPPAPAGDWSAALFALNVTVLADPRAWGLVLVLFALDFFGSVAKLVGLSARTPIQRDGEVPGMRQALYVDGLATVGGAAVGSTSFVTFVESGAGIRAGARTGVASIVTGVLLMGCAAIGPVAGWVPAAAAAGALLFVALGLVPRPSRTDALATGRLAAAAIVAVMGAVTAVTQALDQALLAGLALHLAAEAVRRRRPAPILLLITALLAASVAVQYSID